MIGGLARGNNPDRGAVVVFLKRMDHHQTVPVFTLTQGDPAFLILAVIVIKQVQLHRIDKDLNRLLKAHLMLAEVGPGFERVPLKIILHSGYCSPVFLRSTAQITDHLLGLMLHDHALEQGLDDLLLFLRHAGNRLELKP